MDRLKGTLALRLTLWYSSIFSLSALVACLIIYLMIRAVVHDQMDRALEAETREFALLLSAGGMQQLKTGIISESLSEGAENIFLRVFSGEGDLLAETDLSAWQGLPPAGGIAERLNSQGSAHDFETLHLHGQKYPTRVINAFIDDSTILQFGASLKRNETFLSILLEVFIPLMAGVTMLAGLSGWFMARRALAGVTEVTQTALEISAGAFGRRVSVKNRGAEIELMAAAFNRMLDRINAVFGEMKTVNDNIAHDLRSPLARIRSAAEMALTTETSDAENKATLAGMIDDCDRLMEMINTMLDISEAEAGALEPKWDTVDVGGIVTNACELFLPVAEVKQIRLSRAVSGECRLRADARMLQRMVGNLLDNALKYTPDGGRIDIAASDEAEGVVIQVKDSGIGIPAEEQPLIFRKFYRCDRSRAEHGNGLGLSLAGAIATAHGGRIHLDSEPGKGSVFTVTLPRTTSVGRPVSGAP